MNAPARPTSTAAVVSLVFGILAWVGLPVIAAIVAVVAGHVARADIRRSAGALDGDGLALVGLILGWTHLLLAVLLVLAVLLFFGGLAAFLAAAAAAGA